MDIDQGGRRALKRRWKVYCVGELIGFVWLRIKPFAGCL